MSRTIPIALESHLGSRRITLAVCCKATRVDGTVFGFTDIDIDLPFESVLYRSAGLGFTISANEATAQLTADNHEVTGILSGPGLTTDDILAGLWDYAELEFFQVNYRDLTQGSFSESTGNIGKITLNSLGFVVEFLDVKQRLAMNMLRVVSNMCDAILGDARCKVDLTSFLETATAGASPTERTFVDTARTEADGWWNGGNLTVTSSVVTESVGLKMEIKRSTAAGAFDLVMPLFYGITAGDTFSLSPGCNKMKRLADGTFGGDCIVKFSNAANFMGFDDVPGADAVLNYQVS